MRDKIQPDLNSVELVVKGSEYDFVIAAAVLTELCAGLSDKGKIIINAFPQDDCALVVITSDTDLPDNDIANLISNKYAENMDEAAYWLHLIKLLCEGNLWDFSAENLGCGKIGFALRMPFAEKLEDCVLRDIRIGAIQEILAFVFAIK